MPINDKAKEDILSAISLTGSPEESHSIQKQIILGSRNNLSHIADFSSGSPRLRRSILPKFQLIINKPLLLSVLPAFEMRCCLCKLVITFPAWYYHVKYAVNHFHYFICFDSHSTDKPSTSCFRR